MKKTILKIALSLLVLQALSACSKPLATPYPEQHAQALQQADEKRNQSAQQAAEIPNQLALVQRLFSDLKRQDLAQLIDQTYAEELYFNDTIHTFTTRQQLKEYMLQTADKVNQTTTVFEDVAKSGDDYYVRWRMIIEADIGVKTIRSESIGVTQFRFNSEGKIILHQDFWDNTEGFFRHIPVVGGMIKQIKNRM